MPFGPTIFERITIIGLGLIGGSIARAVRKYKLADIIVGCDANNTAVTYARSHNYIDVAAGSPETAVPNSQLVILATPPSSFETIVKAMKPHLQPGVIIMDTASVKRVTMQSIGSHLPVHADFIPAHPIAGSEESGISAGHADLFNNCRVVVTPNEPLETDNFRRITHFWKGMGARVDAMPPDMHDMIYGYVSHLPHLLSFASRQIVDTQAENFSSLQKSFLRIGYSDPILWNDLFHLNQDNLTASLSRYIDAINHVRTELNNAPPDTPQTPDEQQARNVLFPRVAAACLITTIMEAERNAGVPFAKYAGPGLQDFTSPASNDPDGDMEAISSNYEYTAKVLEEYQAILQDYYDMLSQQEFKALAQAITR